MKQTSAKLEKLNEDAQEEIDALKSGSDESLQIAINTEFNKDRPDKVRVRLIKKIAAERGISLDLPESEPSFLGL